jgi:hypothetical protein
MTWTLMLQSFAILRKDKRLVIFPILSALAVIALTIPYVTVFTGWHWWHPSNVQWTEVHGPGASTYAWLFLWYLVVSFPMVFFNCALAACAQIQFSGGEPTIAEGLRLAGRKTGSILMWAVVTSTVGVILRYIEDRVGLIGKIIVSLFGAGWAIATYLIVPVLVLEDLDVMESIRRSCQLLKKTWGEQLIAGINFFWITLLLAIPGILLGVLAGFLLGALAIPLGILYFVALVAVMSAVRQIFVVALYRYAVSGEAPAGYSQEALGGAFRRR